MKILLLIISFLIIQDNLLSQNNNVTYEQLALNYFFDSVLSKDCEKHKRIYYYPSVNNRHSELISTSGFEDYLVSDSSGLESVRIEQREIDNLVFNSKSLVAKKKYQCGKVRKIKRNYSYNNKPTLFVQVFKHSCYRQGKYIVEITASDKDLKTYYFFEIGKFDYSVKRWSKLIRSL